MKLIIAGSRDFSDYSLLEEEVDGFLRDVADPIEIVSGTARGADKLGERYANERGLEVKKFPADWEFYGKTAGYIRNLEMAKYADSCICFWDGKSRGTKSMIRICRDLGINHKVINYENRR